MNNAQVIGAALAGLRGERLTLDRLRDLVVAQPDELLVRVRASALNRADLLQREGKYPAPPGFPQEIPGLEFAGDVAAEAEADRWAVARSAAASARAKASAAVRP